MILHDENAARTDFKAFSASGAFVAIQFKRNDIS
jgi:hypothetical protein